MRMCFWFFVYLSVSTSTTFGASLYGVQESYAINHNRDAIEVAKKPVSQSRYFFLIVYRSTCPYCQRFAPVLNDYANAHNMAVIGITTDGARIPEFPDTVPLTQELKNRLFERSDVRVPALFLVEKKRHRVFLVSEGYLNEMQLARRVGELMEHLYQIDRGAEND